MMMQRDRKIQFYSQLSFEESCLSLFYQILNHIGKA